METIVSIGNQGFDRLREEGRIIFMWTKQDLSKNGGNQGMLLL